ERSITYNSLSNQLLVLRGIVNGNPNPTLPEVHVINGDTGVELYKLNVTTIATNTRSELSGSNPLNLAAISAGEDGSIYACSEVPNASGGAGGFDTNKLLKVYRWADSG